MSGENCEHKWIENRRFGGEDYEVYCERCKRLAPSHLSTLRKIATLRAALAAAEAVVEAAKTIEPALPHGYLLLRDALAVYDRAKESMLGGEA